MTNLHTFPMQKENVEELHSCSQRSSCWVNWLGCNRHGNQEWWFMLIYLHFGLSALYFSLLNLLSASLLVLSICRMFHTAFLSNCLFSAFTNCDEKEYEDVSETVDHLQKTPCINMGSISSDANVRHPTGQNLCKLIWRIQRWPRCGLEFKDTQFRKGNSQPTTLDVQQTLWMSGVQNPACLSSTLAPGPSAPCLHFSK